MLHVMKIFIIILLEDVRTTLSTQNYIISYIIYVIRLGHIYDLLKDRRKDAVTIVNFASLSYKTKIFHVAMRHASVLR